MRYLISLLLLTLTGFAQGFSDASAPFLLSSSSLRRGLVAYWRMEEAYGSRYDCSQYGNVLSDNRTVSSTIGGNSGYAVAFTTSASNWLSSASTASLQMGPVDFSISCWFRLTQYPQTSGQSPLVVKDSATSGKREYILVTAGLSTATNTSFYVFKATDSAVSVTNIMPTLNTWHHAVAVHDSVAKAIYLYLDGVPKTNTYTGSLQAASDAQFRIGSSAHTASVNKFDGWMDEVAIWKNRALTSNEVIRIYNGGLSGTFPSFKPIQFQDTIAPIGSISTLNDAANEYCHAPTLATDGTTMFAQYSLGTYHGATNADIYLRYSSDFGSTWSGRTKTFDGGGTNGLFSGGLTKLANGTLLASFFKNDATSISLGVFTSIGTISGTSVSWSASNAVTTTLTTPAMAAKGIQLGNGDILLPIYGIDAGVNTTNFAIAVVKSTDNGATFGNQVIVAAGSATRSWTEANGLLMTSGRILLFLRCDFGSIGYHTSFSDDSGATWSSPASILATTTPGKPTIELLPPPDGRIFFIARWSGATNCFYCNSRTLGTNFIGGTFYGPGSVNNEYCSSTFVNNRLLTLIATELSASRSKVEFQEFSY